MPLKLDLKNGEKILINGAVLQVAGADTQIIVHNQATILRNKDIVALEDCATPASRTYFALQSAYIFPDKAAHYLTLFTNLQTEYLAAAPSSRPIFDEINKALTNEKLFQALKSCKKLIKHEAEKIEIYQARLAKTGS